ncbi:hypothetical protein [Ilumatobacter sp.]|uniref:hypothetical protein n=1 Tax=Ilumatobacter sp. TaxID=1967498 RepID=UPI003B52BAC6
MSASATGFDTPITTGDDGSLTGPFRAPVQMLADQEYGGHASVHDDAEAAKLGLAGAPIEGPTHFSQFDPLAVARWGPSWFESGCISSHFLNMVVEGEEVQAALDPNGDSSATIRAVKPDGTPVLTGTASVGRATTTELDVRRERGTGDPGELHIVDQLEIGMTSDPVGVSMDLDTANGALYPFSLAQKLDAITEASSWYRPAGDSPWGGAIVPTEMVSVLAHRSGGRFPVRGPAVGLFIDLEVRYVEGPVRVGRAYEVRHEIVGIGQGRSVESYWTESTLTDADAGTHVATVLLHQGVFKASYAGHPDSDG